MSGGRRSAESAQRCASAVEARQAAITVLGDRANLLIIREAFRRTRENHPFRVDAIVVLPDHLHTIWRLPDDDGDYSQRWRLIKHFVAIGVRGGPNRRGEKAVWQRRFWEHAIRDETDWANHMDYIHYNPVKHGYVQRPDDWPHGSFRKAIDAGWYPPGWGEAEPFNIAE